MRSLQLFFLFSFSCFLSCQQAQEQDLPDLTSGEGMGKTTSGKGNIVFQSADGGQTWQDISEGLPEGIKPGTFFADDDELMLCTDKGIYKNSTASKTANWEKELSTDQLFTHVAAVPAGVMAVSNNGQIFQKSNDTGVWMPIFTNFEGQYVNTVFTAKDGSIFIGSDIRWGRGLKGIFKSTDQGTTWKHVMQDGWGIQLVESDGVLLSTSNQGGILRSTDGGEHWDVAMGEDGVGIAVEAIKGGFAAITYNAESETRRIRTSTDGGKTWQPIDAGLPPSKLIASIKQVGDALYCGHPKGIYRSDDQGKSWKLLLPAIGEKVFNLSVAGGMLYAVLREAGC